MFLSFSHVNFLIPQVCACTCVCMCYLRRENQKFFYALVCTNKFTSLIIDDFTDSTVTNGLCRDLIDWIDSYWDVDFIDSIVCGGPYRGVNIGFLQGLLIPVKISLLCTWEYFGWEISAHPISELHHFLMLYSTNISEVLDDYQLVDIVSKIKDKV